MCTGSNDSTLFGAAALRAFGLSEFLTLSAMPYLLYSLVLRAHLVLLFANMTKREACLR